MIRISQLKLPVTHTEEDLLQAVRKKLQCKDRPLTFEIVRQSLDARKGEKFFVYTIDVSIAGEKKILQKVNNNNIMSTNTPSYHFPAPGETSLSYRPVIVGCGPAGLMCGWYLARYGYRPLILERGEEASVRKKRVDEFWEKGVLDPDSNVQFGEGGAGTFSDGKLNTLVKDESGRNKEVLKRFVKAGAPEQILYQQKPHLGTDMLIGIVQTLRHQIESMGGSFRFHTRVTGFKTDQDGLQAVVVNDDEVIPANVCILAIGHSARDTFAVLRDSGIYMEPKPFAVGVRIEHPQILINQALYGEDENQILGPASYKVTHTTSTGRGVYSFCMCPGGYVVNASTEPGRLAVNGMSYQARDGKNANSALIVTVGIRDFYKGDVLDGVAFQRRLEEAAFQEGEGRIPVQRYEDFRLDRPSTGAGSVQPCMKGAYAFSNVRSVLPGFVSEALLEGVPAFAGKIHGFDLPDALLSGVESRTSSPVRIARNRDFLSNISGIYPCGEGAGYAGGITSAAMDGIKTAEAVRKRFSPF